MLFAFARLRIVIVAAAIASLITLAAPAQAAPPSGPRERVMVSFQPGTAGADMAAAESDAGAALERTIDQLGVRVLSVPAGDAARAAERLSHNPNVAYAEVDGQGQGAAVPNDPMWSQQWGPSLVGAPAAWDSGVGSSSVTVALLDSGINAAHEDLTGRIVAGYDFVNADSDPADDQGHGTSVTGVAAASGSNNLGLAGMCWSCQIMPVKVLDANNWASWSNLSSGIVWAVDHGASVLSISIIGSSGGTTLQNAVRYATDRGVLVVAAAGNTGDTALGYPAAFDEALSVAGSTSTDSRYSWSTYGSWVDVAAPGCNPSTTRSGGYGSFCGTSSATPLVAGIAALLRSAKPTATVAELRSAITGTAVPVGSWVAYGRVNAQAAVAAIGSSSAPPPPPPPTPAVPAPVTTTFSGALNTKTTSRTFSLVVGEGALSASLQFSKGPLTLQLVNPSGTVVATSQGGSPVQLGANVTAGTWKLVVSGSVKTSFTLTATAPAP